MLAAAGETAAVENYVDSAMTCVQRDPTLAQRCPPILAQDQ